jgi:hypothetical protein
MEFGKSVSYGAELEEKVPFPVSFGKNDRYVTALDRTP